MNRFKIAIDCIALRFNRASNSIEILLVKRNNEPYLGHWALPGGFVKTTEEFIDTAIKVLKKETSIYDKDMKQLKAYSLTDSNDKNRIISIAFFSFISLGLTNSHLGDHDCEWHDVNDLPKLPFDHTKKVKDLMSFLRLNISTQPIVYRLLQKKFTLNEVQRVHECILGKNFDNRNFRKKLKNLTYLKSSGDMEKNVSHRPGILYQFNEKEFNKTLNYLNQ